MPNRWATSFLDRATPTSPSWASTRALKTSIRWSRESFLSAIFTSSLCHQPAVFYQASARPPLPAARPLLYDPTTGPAGGPTLFPGGPDGQEVVRGQPVL